MLASSNPFVLCSLALNHKALSSLTLLPGVQQFTVVYKLRSLGFWRPHLDHVTFGDLYGVGVTLGLIGGDHAVPFGHVA